MFLLPFDYAVRNLGRSPLRLAATVAGGTLVVLVLLTAASFVQGMRRSLSVSTGNHNVLFVGTGSEESLERSQIGGAIPGQILGGVPGIRTAFDAPFLSPEVHVALVFSRTRDRREELRALVRGVMPAAYLVHGQVQVIEGRQPQQGRSELLAGVLASVKLGVPDETLAVGRTLWFDDREWTIVGRFRAPGSVMESELWADLGDVQVASRRDDRSLSCVAATLDGTDVASAKEWTEGRLDLELSALTEAEYYESLQRFYRPVRIMVWTTAALISLAGLVGGLNTLYAAFAARSRELGMLRTLGFSRTAIVIGLMQESLLATGAGTLLACALARLFVHGRAVRFSMGVFELQVDAVTLAVGIACGVLVGFVGALVPAWRCLRLSIPESLKSA
jgi:putative ABC transport system permease protein